MRKHSFFVPLLALGAVLVTDSTTYELNERVLQVYNNSTADSDTKSIEAMRKMLSGNSIIDDQEILKDSLLFDDSFHLQNKLASIMKEIVNGSGEPNAIVDFVSSIQNEYDLEQAVCLFFLGDAYVEQLAFLDIIISSKVDVFARWYKTALSLASMSDDAELRHYSFDVLDAYKSDFEKVL